MRAAVLSPAASWSRNRWSVHTTRVIMFALALYALGNVGRIPLLDLGGRQAPLLINDLCVMGVLVAGGLAMGNARSLKLNDVALAALLFAAIGAISAVAAIPRYGLSGFEVVASLAYLARWLVYFGLYVVIVNCVRAGDVEPVWRLIERVFLVMCTFGLLQAAFLPNFAFAVFPDSGATEWDVQGHRLVSTILDPNIMAGLIDVVLLVMLARMAFGVRTPLWKPLLLFAALLTTLSRGGLLSFVIGGLVIVAVRGLNKHLGRLAVVVAVLLTLAAPSIASFAQGYSRFSLSDSSALARLVAWQRAIAVFAESPVLGVGFNTYGFVQEHRGFERLGSHSYSSEGGLLFIAVMTGLVGLVVYLVMLWCVLRRCRQGWMLRDAQPAQRGMFLGVAAATVAVLVDTLFVNTLLVPFMMELLWVLWGLTYIALRDLRGPVSPQALVASAAR
jgi:O-antigen ligase